jgi:hypothetical protein
VQFWEGIVLAAAAESGRPPRDDGASLRLTAAALRLGQFTVRELSDAALANYETARDFVARRRESGVLVPIDEAQVASFENDEENSAPGRPPQRYTISDNQRSRTEERLKAIRGSLANVARAAFSNSIGFEAASDQSIGLEDQVGPLMILERAVRALSNAAEISAEDRQARIGDIEILRGAAERDVTALTTRGAEPLSILHFGRRLGAVTAQFDELKQALTKRELPSESWRPLVDELVLACRGQWTGGVATAKAINQFFILFDGIPERQDPVTSQLLRSCVLDAVSVVSFETAAYSPGDWQQLRNWLHRVQLVAPSVVRAMFVAVDGRTANAWSMINEVSRFDKIRAAYDLASPDSHVGSALRRADKHRGRMFCFDLALEPNLGQKCEAEGINYVAHASSAALVKGLVRRTSDTDRNPP